jgi:hypothetical protein
MFVAMCTRLLFTGALFEIAKGWKQFKYAWLNQLQYIHLMEEHIATYDTHKDLQGSS